MQRKEIDARSRACPQPVLMTKAALDEGHRIFVVVVDNESAAQNISRFATNSGCAVTVLSKDDSTIRLEICRRDADDKPEKAQPKERETAPCGVPSSLTKTLVIQAESIGQGCPELGKQLMAQFLSTLAVNETLPEHLILLNAGVKLACTDSEATAALQDLVARGVEVMVCGTCLNHFDLHKHLVVGRPTNAHEVLNILLGSNVVTWG